MSRIGNNPIIVPEGVKVNIDGSAIVISGKNGTHSHHLHENIKMIFEDDVIKLDRIDEIEISIVTRKGDQIDFVDLHDVKCQLEFKRMS